MHHVCWILWLSLSIVTTNHAHHDYIVIGAGPAGLQMGYFLKEAQRDYIVVERNKKPGSFFERMPRHDQLISINKRHTGETNAEFNLRHDWNSLLSHNRSLTFTRYSNAFFPHRKEMLNYLRDFQQQLEIDVLFETDVHDVKQICTSLACNQRFTMKDQHGTFFSCRTLIVATGLGKPHMPVFEGDHLTENYATVSINPEDYEGQSVLILGNGNSAFELAKSIYGSTNLVHMLSRSPIRLSWATHYVGDLRAINNELLDTYQLKSLDAVVEASLDMINIVRTQDDKLRVKWAKGHRFGNQSNDPDPDNFPLRKPYDRVIQCLGFTFDDSLFANASRVMMSTKSSHSKFPPTDALYKSTHVDGLYFAGAASHGVDYRKSAGGFIHGFRYTSRALYRYLEWHNHAVRWPSRTLPISHLLTAILKRINEASAIYQMFGVLGDVILLSKCRRQFTYLEEFPVGSLHTLAEDTGHEVNELIVIVFAYGEHFSIAGRDVFAWNRARGGSTQNAHLSNFLHPILYHYQHQPTVEEMSGKHSGESMPRAHRMHHVVEDLLTQWTAPLSHVLPLRRFLEAVVGADLTGYSASSCLQKTLLYRSIPLSCEQRQPVLV